MDEVYESAYFDRLLTAISFNPEEFRLKTDLEKLNYFYKMFTSTPGISLLPLYWIANQNDYHREHKSNDKSLKLRIEGNRLYAMRNFSLAFEYYNESAGYAEPDTEFLGLAYANRSAVLFELDMHESCLANIKLARETKYPRRLYEKLEKREKDCHEAIKNSKTRTELKIELCSDPHPTVPFIANCLYNRDKKAIHTSKTLNPGDLVAVENPFCAFLDKDQARKYCWYCCKRSFELIPCEHCVFSQFCSKECREKGFAIHKYECPVIKILICFQIKFFQFPIRLLFTAMSLFKSVDDYRKFLENPDNHKDSIFEMDKLTFDSKEYFKLICGTNTFKNDPEISTHLFLWVANAKKFMLELTDVKNEFFTETDISFLDEQLLHFVKIIYFKDLNKRTSTFGCRMYGLSKHLRHSCEPNVIRITSGVQSFLFVLRTIAPKEELLESYWDEHCFPVETWRYVSLKYCKFTCNCKRCIFAVRWLFYFHHDPRIPNSGIYSDFEARDEFNRDYAEKNYKRFANFIKKYQKYSPNVLLEMAEACLQKCLHIIIQKEIKN